MFKELYNIVHKMAFIPGSETHPISEAQSVSNNRLFDVIQIADSDGNIINPAQGSVVFDGEVTISSEVEIKNDAGNPVPISVAIRTPTTTSVVSSVTSVTILGTNENRRGFSISNISSSKLYLSFSNPATIANSWIEVPAGAFLLLDQQLIVGNAIYGIWSSANGTAQVTEYV